MVRFTNFARVRNFMTHFWPSAVGYVTNSPPAALQNERRDPSVLLTFYLPVGDIASSVTWLLSSAFYMR